MTLRLVPGTVECLLLIQDRIPIDNQMALFELDEHPLLDRLGSTEIAVQRQVKPPAEPTVWPDLVVVIGPPGSGKSTLAKQLIQEHPDWALANHISVEIAPRRNFATSHNIFRVILDGLSLAKSNRWGTGTGKRSIVPPLRRSLTSGFTVASHIPARCASRKT